MSRRAGQIVSYLILFVACVYGAGCEGCSGAPANFNKVSLATSKPVVLQGQTTTIAAQVANDPGNGGVSWALSGAGTLSNSTKTTVTYNAPATVTAETVVTVKASSVDYPAQGSTIQITVEPPAAITTTSLPGGNYGSPYTATVNATGGEPPFTWEIAGGSLTTGLMLGTSNTRAVTISGTPMAQANSNFTIEILDATGGSATQALSIAIGAPLPLAVVTTTLPSAGLNANYAPVTLQASGGVPPFSWQVISGELPPGITLSGAGVLSGTPVAAGTYTFEVEVADAESPAKTAQATLSITVNNLNVLSGNYAFAFNGFASNGEPVSIAGSFTADGKGDLTGGVEDVNVMGSAPKNQTFTGTYTMSSNNQGVLTFSSLSGSPAYSFAIDSNGLHARMIEFDASGTRGSGDLEFRTVSTCTASTLNGNYAFGLVGQQEAVSGVSAAGPDVIVGSFTAAGAIAPSTAGSIGPGELDANTPVRVTTQDQTVAGGYQATTQATRCALTLSSTLQTMNFSVYPVSTEQFFVVETDATGASAPILTAGTIQEQFGAPFEGAAGSTFTETSVAALTGRLPSGNAYLPDVALSTLTGTGSASFTLQAVENQAGTVVTWAPTGGTFTEADQYGRVATNVVSPFGPVFYMISQNEAFCIGEDENQSSQPYPFFGIFQPQSSGPFSAATIASAFLEGTAAPAASSVPDITGVVGFTETNATQGTLTGLQNESASGGNTSGQTVTGGYVSLSTTAGTGTMAETSPATLTASYLVVSPSEVLMIMTTTGDTNPVILIFEQ